MRSDERRATHHVPRASIRLELVAVVVADPPGLADHLDALDRVDRASRHVSGWGSPLGRESMQSWWFLPAMPELYPSHAPVSHVRTSSLRAPCRVASWKSAEHGSRRRRCPCPLPRPRRRRGALRRAGRVADPGRRRRRRTRHAGVGDRQPRHRHAPPSARAEDTVHAARAAMADLLGRPTRRDRVRPEHDPADLRPGAHAGRRLGARRRGGGQPARPRRQRPSLGDRRRARRRDRALRRLRPRQSPNSRRPTWPQQLSARTRLVALTGASNLLGTRPDLVTIADLVHDAGALLFVDGVHLTAHASVDVRALGADVFACSPYKFFGPHCGVLAADPALLEQLHPDKLLPSSDAVPERFELGTLPYELLAGTTAAVDFIAGLDRPDRVAARAHRRRVRRRRRARGRPAHPHREGAAGSARRHHPLAGRATHPDPAAHLRRPRPGRGVPLPRRARGQRAGRHVLRLRARAAARHLARRRAADRPGALQRRLRRRPVARRIDRFHRLSTRVDVILIETVP